MHSQKSAQKPRSFKVSRGHWRTKPQTRVLLGLPPGYPIPNALCRLPDSALEKMVQTAAQRMIAKQAEMQGHIMADVANAADQLSVEDPHLVPVS